MQKKTKICLLNDSFPPLIDGVANTVMNYARILNNSETSECIVGTPAYPDASYDMYPYRVIPYQSFDTTALFGYRTGNPLEASAVKEMTAFQPDIIHTHCPAMSTLMARILRGSTGAPVVFTYHTKFDEDIAKRFPSKLLQKESIRAMIDNIEACDEVWAVSKGAGENLRSLGYEGDIRIVQNGVDLTKGKATDEEVRKETKGCDLPEHVPVCLFVGRLMNYKGLPYIMEALRYLNTNNIDFRMVFVGDGDDRMYLERTAEEYGIDKKVFFTGAIRDRKALRAWYTRADLFLFPSTYDTNGIVVREAAACGLASVLIRDSCAAEGITDARNGFLTEQSGGAIAVLLARLFSDLEHVRQTGQNAMDEIYISWEDSVHQAFEYYQEILEKKANGTMPKHRHNHSERVLTQAAELSKNAESIRMRWQGM